MAGRMYENVKTWNPIVGCKFSCVYCTPSFQRQAKRRKKSCPTCYNYEPHFHPERVRLPPSKTIFACAYGDVAWANKDWIDWVINVIENNPEKEFYIQSKDPGVFLVWEEFYDLPKNLVLGTTIESNLTRYCTPSSYRSYSEISSAPPPPQRAETMQYLSHRRKYVTVEPILDFSTPEEFANMLKKICPEFVYIGYDNHSCKLPEPSLMKTLDLLDRLDFTEVRLKTIREAWFIRERTIDLPPQLACTLPQMRCMK